MNERKPCPFCGNEYPLLYKDYYSGCYMIHCPNCDIYFRIGAGEKETIRERIISAWNRRYDEKANHR